jgi:hypothetical protein
MELLLIAAAIALARWVASTFSAEEVPPPPVPAAPTPPRVRRRRPTSALPVPFAVTPVTPPVIPVETRPLRVVAPRPTPRFRVVAQFKGSAALRQAIIAREVLGPPVSMRGR